MNLLVLFIFFGGLFLLELFYFKIADKNNIIDHPNHRSSHSQITIRGGGIIFPIALLLASFYWNFEYPYFLAGLLLISFISFVDDIKPASRRIRIIFHVTAVGLLFYELHIYSFSIYWILLGIILAIGTINAINFMDGINGITGGYSLLTIFTLYYIDRFIISFTDENMLEVSIISLLVFNFFNFRTKAKCFAGDIGSVSIAFIVLFFLLQLIIKTKDIGYLLLLLTYGLDTITTISLRILRKENVFEPHRRHFYQFLANENKAPHLLVASGYIAVQGVINVFLINFLPKSFVTILIVMLVITLTFIFLRVKTEGRERLFNVGK